MNKTLFGSGLAKFLGMLSIALCCCGGTPSAYARSGVTITSEGWAPRFEVECATEDCRTVTIKRVSNGQLTGEIGPFGRDQLNRYLTESSWPKFYLITQKPMSFDRGAGGLNAFLPLFQVAAWILAIPRDAIELVTDQNERTIKAVGRISEPKSGSVSLSFKDFRRLNQSFDHILGCGNQLVAAR